MGACACRRSAIGVLRISVEHGAVTACALVSGEGGPERELPAAGTSADALLLDRAFREIDEYLAGRRRRFTLPLAPAGTPFQKEVWRVMTEIPFGRTLSYGEVARRCGRPGAARAVGGACRSNPVLLFQPCHRVVASASPGGFGGGLPLKLRLLKLEGVPSWGKRRGR